MTVPVPKPEGLSLSDFTEFLYTAFFASRFPPESGVDVNPLFEDMSPCVRAAWRSAAETALRLAPQVRTAYLRAPVGPNAMYHQP